MWFTWYRIMNQGKLPIQWMLVFDEDTIYDFDSNVFENRRKSSKVNMKDDATTTSNIDNENIKFRLKISKLPYFNGKQDAWINFREV